MSEEHDAWWVIHAEELRKALRRCYRGEDPEIMYLELIANSEQQGGQDG